MRERVTLCSWVRKSSWKCIWHSDKLNLPHHLLQKKNKKSPMSTWTEIKIGHITSACHLPILLCACVSVFQISWSLWANMTHKTSSFQKKRHRRKPEDPHSVHLKLKTTLIWVYITCSYSTKASPEDRTRSLLCSSDSLRMSVRGFHADEKLNNNKQKDGAIIS